MRASGTFTPDVAPEARRCAIYTRKSTSVGLEQDFNSLDAQREACTAYIQQAARLDARRRALRRRRLHGREHREASLSEAPDRHRRQEDRRRGRLQGRPPEPVAPRLREADGAVRSSRSFLRIRHPELLDGRRDGAADSQHAHELRRVREGDDRREDARQDRSRTTKGKVDGRHRPPRLHGQRKATCRERARGRPRARDLRPLPRAAVDSGGRSASERSEPLHEAARRRPDGRITEARPWTKADVLGVIKNPVYAGYMRSHGEFYDGEHEALVDRETFSRARALLDGAQGRRTIRPATRTTFCGGFSAVRAAARRSRQPRPGRVGPSTATTAASGGTRKARRRAPRRLFPPAAIEAYVIERLREFAAEGTRPMPPRSRPLGSLAASPTSIPSGTS